MVKNRDYGLTDIDEDELFKRHLAHVIRATDPGAIQSLFRAIASERNFFIQKGRDLPRLQDPAQAASFDVASLGEDPDLYAELIALRNLNSLTTLEEERKTFLESRLLKSLDAEAFEKRALDLLSKSVGAQSYGRYQVATIRELISTAILRHQIRGTHTSFEALGRILGFIDIKITELWSRYSIKDPSNPRAVRNITDFASTPEQSPYWPLGNVYSGILEKSIPRGNPSYLALEPFQSPLASALYDPTDLDDGDPYTVEFLEANGDLESEYQYNRVVDGHNPFGNFTSVISGRLVPSTYVLTGGTSQKRASVNIPLRNSSDYVTFEAITIGDWANGVILKITTSSNGNQRISLTGSQSKIKFKSSYFDIALTMDNEIFPSLFTPTPIETNPSAAHADLDLSYNPTVLNITDVSNSFLGPLFPRITLDGAVPSERSLVRIAGTGSLNGDWKVLSVVDTDVMVLEGGTYRYDWTGGGTCTYGRQAGDYPWTGSANGVQALADPAELYQMPTQVYNEIVATLRSMVEEIRPLTREVRKESLGYLLRDQVNYAPFTVTNQVVLESENGTKYEATIQEGNTLVWSVSTETVTQIVQKDEVDGLLYQWTISNDGELSFVRYNGDSLTIENVVFLQDGSLKAFFYPSNGELIGSINSPEQVVSSLHLDGTVDESVIGLEYAKVVENPPEELIEFFNEEASSSDVPSDDFAFQSRPEDALDINNLLGDIIETFIHTDFPDDAGTSFATRGTSWYYDLSGHFFGLKSRTRHCGIHDQIIEPPQSGTEIHEDGLINNYPIGIANHHNVVAWRDRVSNEPYTSYYIHETENNNKRIGARRIDQTLIGDGPYEVGVPNVVGVGVTCNNRVFGASQSPSMDLPWKPQTSGKYNGLSDVQGTLGTTVYDSISRDIMILEDIGDLQKGQQVFVRNNDAVDEILLFQYDVGSQKWHALLKQATTPKPVNGDFFVTVPETLTLWEDGDVTVEIDAPLALTFESPKYKIMAHNPISGWRELESGDLTDGGVVTTLSALGNETIHLALKTSTAVDFVMSLDIDVGEMTDSSYTGALMWQGGHRDDIAINIIQDGESWDNITLNDIPSTTGLETGSQWWRGGNWDLSPYSPDPGYETNTYYIMVWLQTAEGPTDILRDSSGSTGSGVWEIAEVGGPSTLIDASTLNALESGLESIDGVELYQTTYSDWGGGLVVYSVGYTSSVGEFRVVSV